MVNHLIHMQNCNIKSPCIQLWNRMKLFFSPYPPYLAYGWLFYRYNQNYSNQSGTVEIYSVVLPQNKSQPSKAGFLSASSLGSEKLRQRSTGTQEGNVHNPMTQPVIAQAEMLLDNPDEELRNIGIK